MITILMLLAGIVCLFKNEIQINKEKSVRGVPIKILGVILIACSILFYYLLEVVGFERIGDFGWYIAACFAVPFSYLVFIIIFCGKPIADKK